jgi:hypothetical protein
MMRAWPVVALAALALLPLAAQDVQVLTATFIRNFERAEDLDTRLAVVRDAVASKVAGMGAFYRGVIELVRRRAAETASDSRVREMAALALGRIAAERYGDARDAVWELFKAAPDPATRIDALRALEGTAAGDRQLVTAMAAYLDSQNRLFGTQSRPDPQIVLALIRALGAIRDPVAFRSLFAARVLGYSAEITAAADAALLATEGNLQELFAAIIRSGTAVERLDAFALAASSPRIDQSGKAELAEEALRAGLALSAPAAESRSVGRELRASAMAVLEAARWSRASPLAVEHFSTAALEYDRGQVDITYLIRAVNGLAAMGTHAAAERLTLYLELLNSYREYGKAYDELIVLAVIAGLGRLGDKVAFANLSYAQYLNYSDRVKRAARDAMNSLKW